MMDARLVWDTWRRILTSDALVQKVLYPNGSDVRNGADLTAQERAILADYASTPAATRTNIGMYRRGLARNALAALALAPLSRQLLYTSGLDVDEVAKAFVQSTGYRDDGPNFWGIAGGFIAHLATLPEFATRLHQDVLALDAATVALARRLGATPVDMWPENAASPAGEAGAHPGDDPGGAFVASRAAVVASSHHDLTAWLENPEDVDANDPLPAGTRHWLICFPAPDAAPAYAELSDRAACAFKLLSTPRTVEELSRALEGVDHADMRKVISSLVDIGVVTRDRADAASRSRAGTEHAGAATLPDEGFGMLDPAVEILDVEIAGSQLLCHSHFDLGMAVPPGEGLLDVVIALGGKPVNLGDLRAACDDQRILEKILTSLHQHGFLHLTSPGGPSGEELANLRAAARQRRDASLRHAICVDLDSGVSLARLSAELRGGAHPSDVSFRCARLCAHKATLAALAHLRQSGEIRWHRAVIKTTDLTCDDDIRQSILRLGASILLEDIAWPAPDHPISGLAELTSKCLAVHVLMKPDRSILDEAARHRAEAWATSAFIAGLCLQLDAAALWPGADASNDEFIAVFDAVRALETALGDVCIINMPGDDVLLGNAAAAPNSGELSGFETDFRRAYLRWRLPLLKSFEGDNTFSQTPEAEEKLVGAQDDLLPNHPDLLSLRPGGVVLDVCGGVGRVARRLSPIVGDDGLIISIEMLRCVSDRARGFACQKNLTNLDFRPGLAQRIPLPDGSVDAAVNEWTGGIWELGLGQAMVQEMARVVRRGGRIAVTHRLVRLPLTRLEQPWVQFSDIYSWMRQAFACPELTIIHEKVWGQIAPSLVGENAAAWRKQYVLPLINPFDVIYNCEESPGPHADVCLTMIAERH